MTDTSRWLAVVLVLVVPGLVLAQAPKRKTAAVQVYAATATDAEVANQVRKIAVDTLENYRNLLTRRYLTDKDVKLAETLGELVTGAVRKVSTGMRSKVFDEGVEELDRAYLLAKGALGELAPDLVGQLYFGLAMGKAVMGNAGLATDYMTLFANLVGESGRQKVGYNKTFLAIWDGAWARMTKAHKYKVTITVDPPGALVGVDGRTWGKAPLEVELTPGNHLVQVEVEGYERGGWVKDPGLHGKNWKLKVSPYASRQRYLDTVARLGAYFAPVAPQPEKDRSKKKRGAKVVAPLEPLSEGDVEGALAAVAELLSVDYLLYLTVATEGSTIRLTGAFYSIFGLTRLNETLPRDARIIESAREILLTASDLEVLKKSLAEQKVEERQRRLVRWADELLLGISDGRTSLLARADQWELVKQPRKAEMFRATAKEVSVLEEKARGGRSSAAADPEGATGTLDEVARAWKDLEAKVRSLLAWDIERALRDKQVAELADMMQAVVDALVELKGLLEKKSGVLDKRARGTFAKDLKEMEKWRAQANKLLAKDPLSTEARGLLYRILLKEAELRRLLSLI